MPRVSKKRIQFMRCRILAYDLISILEDAESGRFDYALNLLLMDGTRPVGAFTDAEIVDEYKEGDYDSVSKAQYIQDSRPYQTHKFIRQLWDHGDMSGTHSDEGFTPLPRKKA